VLAQALMPRIESQRANDELLLAKQWVSYILYLKKSYPYLFSSHQGRGVLG